jgi:Ca2+-binding EF-hand superfamily protein
MFGKGTPAPPRGAPPASFFGAGRPPPMIGRPPMMGGARPRGLPLASAAGAAFGTLRVTVQSAKDLTPIDGAGSSVLDSLVVVRVGQSEDMTPVCVKGGTHPSYNAQLTFTIRAEREVDFSVFFRRNGVNGFDDACVGRGRANFMPWIAQGQFIGSVELKNDKGIAAGSVLISAKFERAPPPTVGGGANAAAAAAPVGAVAKPAALAQTSASTSSVSKFTDKEIRDAFDSFDLDRNDFVGAAEIRHVLVNIGENVTDEEIDEMIKMCDKDGDGQVSFPEFYMMVTGKQEAPSASEQAAATGGVGVNATMVAQRNARKTALKNFAADFNVNADFLTKMANKVKRQKKSEAATVDYSEFCSIIGSDPSAVLEKLFKLFDTANAKEIDPREVRQNETFKLT